MLNNRGFSLIELMIVVAIIGILVAVALPQFTSMSEDAKTSKVKQDLDVYVNAIIRYKAAESRPLSGISDLLGKYVANEMKDPWGNPYGLDVDNGCAYSLGPDGKTGTADDIVASYLPPLMLIKTKLVDCGDRLNSGRLGKGDRLELTFSRPLHPADTKTKIQAWISSVDDTIFIFGVDDADGNLTMFKVGDVIPGTEEEDGTGGKTFNNPFGSQIGAGDNWFDRYIAGKPVKERGLKDPANPTAVPDPVDYNIPSLPAAYVPHSAPEKIFIIFGGGPDKDVDWPQIKAGQFYINSEADLFDYSYTDVADCNQINPPRKIDANNNSVLSETGFSKLSF